jgi:hypothetical protein
MQRLHLDDLVGHLLEQEGWTHLNLPAISQTEHQIPIGQGRFHLRRPGDLLHPEREPRAVLDEFKQSMGSLDFAAQYQQEPVAEGGNLIKWHWFQFYDDPPARQSSDRIVVSWDTAMSSKELSSYSACVVLQVKGESAYVLDVVRDRRPCLDEAVGKTADSMDGPLENPGQSIRLNGQQSPIIAMMMPNAPACAIRSLSTCSQCVSSKKSPIEVANKA